MKLRGSTGLVDNLAHLIMKILNMNMNMDIRGRVVTSGITNASP